MCSTARAKRRTASGPSRYDTLGNLTVSFIVAALYFRVSQGGVVRVGVAREANTMTAKALLSRGVDHLVFNTDDMAATIEFYCEVLGMRLVHVARTPRIADQFGAGEPPVPYLRHYFFDM